MIKDNKLLVWEILFDELKSAQSKHPRWPEDPIHAASIIGEESGELTQAALQYFYDGGSLDAMTEEAVQVGAMAIRFLINIQEYRRKNDD